jgi:hypothetical protein
MSAIIHCAIAILPGIDKKRIPINPAMEHASPMIRAVIG